MAEANGGVRKRIHVRGIVQGVGFRPFIYNRARSLHLAGYVLVLAGVIIASRRS